MGSQRDRGASRPLAPGADMDAAQLGLLNAVHAVQRRTSELASELDEIPAFNERYALLVLRQAELRKALLDATLPLIEFWREHDAHPLFTAQRQRLLGAADEVQDLDALARWVEDDVQHCRELRERMLDDDHLIHTESFNEQVSSQIRDGASPFEGLREAALAAGSRVAEIAAEQQLYAMRVAAQEQGVTLTEEVSKDGATRTMTFTFDRPPPRASTWWERIWRRRPR